MTAAADTAHPTFAIDGKEYKIARPPRAYETLRDGVIVAIQYWTLRNGRAFGPTQAAHRPHPGAFTVAELITEVVTSATATRDEHLTSLRRRFNGHGQRLVYRDGHECILFENVRFWGVPREPGDGRRDGAVIGVLPLAELNQSTGPVF